MKLISALRVYLTFRAAEAMSSTTMTRRDVRPGTKDPLERSYHGEMARTLRAGSSGPGSNAPARSSTSSVTVWVALGLVYVVWGSTYLAIKEAIATIPPLLMAATRFLAAGAILFAVTSRRGTAGAEPLGWRQWRAAAIVGIALLVGGNGGVVLAEQRLPSGVVALIVATVPLWMAVIDRVVSGQRLPRMAVAGLILGFAGLALLVLQGGRGGRIDALGAATVTGAAFCWAAGSVYARRAPLPSRPLLGAAMEMLAAGVVLVGLGAALGEFGALHPSQVSLSSLVGLGYLVVFGSIVAYSAYTWLLRNASLSLASTYAYVNPVVALFLGWLFLSEPITARSLGAAAVIVIAVALIVRAQTSRTAPEPA
jgi:drug/metabolite transporter (DMT)-like permease